MPSPAPCPTPQGCPNPEPCSEVMDAQCIIYTGNNILCGQDVIVTTNDNVAEAIENVVDYVCSNLPAPPAYKVYTALLTQSGSGDPSPIILENTIGNIVWQRDTVGEYLATLPSTFTNNKTYLITGHTTSGEIIFDRVDTDRLLLQTLSSTGVAQDSKLNNTTIEIRVYN